MLGGRKTHMLQINQGLKILDGFIIQGGHQKNKLFVIVNIRAAVEIGEIRVSVAGVIGVLAPCL